MRGRVWPHVGVILVAVLASGCRGYNILLWASPIGVSHVHHFGLVANTLHSRGHNVTLLTYNERSRPKSISDSDGIEWISVVDEEQERLLEKVNKMEASVAWNTDFDISGDQMVPLWRQWIINYCAQIFLDESLADTLRSRGYHVVVTDPFSGYCSLLYSRDVLELPYVFYETAPLYPMLAHFFDIPTPLAYVPVAETGFADVMTFGERLHNVYSHYQYLYVWSYYLHIHTSDEGVEKARQRGPLVGQDAIGNTEDALRDTNLLVVNSDLALDYPRPMASNLVYVGGITCSPKSPKLPQDLESVVASSGDAGIIVFSMGTVVHADYMPQSAVDTFLAAFAQLRQTVIWRWDGHIPSERLPKNVIYRKWIPQTDLLANPKTRAFLGHGGLNGVMEAIYYGVPMVAIPIFGDQFDNVAKLQSHGAAIVLMKADVSVETLLNSLNRVIYNSSYKSNMSKRSQILRDQPQSPKDRLTFWVEYIIRHRGAPHLKSTAASQLAWFRYFLLDVMAFIFSVIALVLLIIYKCCKRCYKVICNRKTLKVKSN